MLCNAPIRTTHFYDINSGMLAIHGSVERDFVPVPDMSSCDRNILRAVKDWAIEQGFIESGDRVLLG